MLSPSSHPPIHPIPFLPPTHAPPTHPPTHLVLRVQRRELSLRPLLRLLELLLVLHLLLVLLLQQQLELLPVVLELGRELFGQLLDALLQVQVLETELILGLHGEFGDLHAWGVRERGAERGRAACEHECVRDVCVSHW